MDIYFLAFALAMDSVALSLANGANCKDLKTFEVMKMAFMFSFFQAIMPFLGYILGISFVDFISDIDHFIAFVILVFLGIKMIRQSDEIKDDECLVRLDNKTLIIGAFATSIDALAVGVTFSFAEISILNACVIIGVVCFILCVLGCYIGKYAGEILEKKAMILGGIILMIIGVKILITHLFDVA
ncbi:putative manganese efflux pump MntP [Campylobacter majalis]|uniref:Putative manganese efflux pump MntP n=1 Tax=Campylobacter majalis TaxID=2790656 RepID=A0ABM8Q5C7_9BACT|nr:manganese efflux pump MntP family protein [Campylobacter majalis]CAD7288079.1 putative manganese efflux pump MntP [Campylobacter majalis]